MRTSCLFLAGAERMHEEMEQLNVRLQLFSALNMLHARGGAQTILADLYRFREAADDLGRVYMVDSGAFSMQEGVKVAKKRTSGAWFKEYLAFCEEHLDLFDVFIELDDLNEPLKRRLEWREKLLEVVGKKLMCVLHVDSTDEEYDLLRDDSRIRWIGIASDFVENPKGMTEDDLIGINQAVRQVRRGAGEKVFHGLGITRLSPQWFTRLDLDSCDSTAWLRPKKYGDVIVYKANTVHTYTIDGDKALRQSLLKKYALHWEAAGLDNARIQALDSTELAKTGIVAFRQLQERLWYRGRRLAPRFFDPEWGTGTATVAAQEQDRVLITRINGQLLHPVEVEEDESIDFDALRNEAVMRRAEDADDRFGEALDHALKRPVERPDALTCPPGAVPFSVPGIASVAVVADMEQARAVLDTSVHDTADVETALLTYFSQVHPVTQAPVFLSPLGGSTAIVAHEDTPPDPQVRSKAIGRMLKVLPQVVCDNCVINTSCPEFRDGATCAYNSLFDRLSVRDRDNVIPMAEALVDISVQRAVRAAHQERAMGGQLDSRTSTAIDTGLKHLKELDTLKRAHHDADESLTVTVKTGTGILSKIFGAQGRTAALPETPAVIDVESK